MAIERAEQITHSDDAPLIHDERPSTRLFDVDEYYRMAEVGILRPDERVELIEGEIVVMSPIGRRHIAAVMRLTKLTVSRLAGVAEFGIQNPVRLQHRVEPEPDVAVLLTRPTNAPSYEEALPSADDVLLIIEVAGTSLLYDLGEKSALYARYNIPELWVLDLSGDQLIFHRDPTPTGYANVDCLTRDDTRFLSPLAFPDVRFTVEELLGPQIPGHNVQDTTVAAGDQ